MRDHQRFISTSQQVQADGQTRGESRSRRLPEAVENPIDAYNFSRVGLSVCSLAELSTISASLTLESVPKVALTPVWRSFGRPGQLNSTSVSSLSRTASNRFYKLDEIAIIIFAAVKSNKDPGFLILDFSGNVEEFIGHMAVVQIVTRLANMFENNLRLAATRNERLPTLQFSGELRIPEGFASLGDRQLNAMMTNTCFYGELVRSGSGSVVGKRPTTHQAFVFSSGICSTIKSICQHGQGYTDPSGRFISRKAWLISYSNSCSGT